MKGFMTQKGFMKGFMRLINPFEGFIILRLFFTVWSERRLSGMQNPNRFLDFQNFKLDFFH